MGNCIADEKEDVGMSGIRHMAVGTGTGADAITDEALGMLD